MATSSQQKQRAMNNSAGRNGELSSNRSILLLLGLFVAVFFVFSYLERLNELAAIRSEVVSLQKDLAQAEQRNAELEATQREVAGSIYVGETARSELGLIQPGDDPFVILGQEPLVPGTQNGASTSAIASEPKATEIDIFDINWWRSLFGLQ